VAKYTPAIDRLHALVDEARWVLTDSDLERLRPVNRDAPAEIEAAIRLITTELMPEDQLRAYDPFSAQNLAADWAAKPDLGLLQVMRDPTFLPFTVSQLFRQPNGEPVRLLPYQHAVLLTYFHKQMVLFLGSRGAAKTWLLALYIILKLTFHQGTEVAVVSKTLRQSKLVWSYVEKLWNSSPVFRSLVGEGRNGPKAAMSEGKYVLVIGESIAHFLPMGHDGEGLRGIRATVVASDEFGSLDPQVFAVVIQGFGAVSADPVYKVGERAKADIYSRLGQWSAAQQAALEFASRGNQSIISGTATYAYGHFFDYWQTYKAVVESRGDPGKVRKIFNGDPPPGFDHRRYAVMRMPYSILPKGFMDEATIGRARMLATSSEFLREYECWPPGTPVITAEGLKPIESVTVGDHVLTHRGRFRPVTRTMSKAYSGELQEFVTYGHPTPLAATPEHQFWAGEEAWRSCGDGAERLLWATLKEVSGRESVDVTVVADNLGESDCGRLIWAQPGGSKFTSGQRRDIRRRRAAGEKLVDIANDYGTVPSTIFNVCRRNSIPKGAIPRSIPLDYHFGLVVGYYAAEGSGSASNWSITFSLDGHQDASFTCLVRELVDAIQKTIGITPKIRRTSDNVAAVTVNNRPFHQLMKWVCPGLSHDKRIEPSVLFSNPEFMRGFVVGYWNGDGHKSEQRNLAVATCVNPHLLTQLRVVMSYFGVPTTFRSFDNRPSRFGDRAVVNTRKCFTIYTRGWATNLFRKTFFGLPPIPCGKTRSYHVEPDRFEWSVRQSRRVPYSGPVYNLEVADDHSYSLQNVTAHNCCFPRDSSGFFKRSNIDRCTIGGLSLPPPEFPSGVADFGVARSGDPLRQYVFGIDPAFSNDNFAVVVLELWPDHRRIVHCWTTKKSDHRRREKGGGVSANFYQFAVDELRALFAKFPPRAVVIDAQGGGRTIEEKFREPRPGEVAYYAHDDESVVHLPGEHILHMFQFANANDVSEANWGLAKDLESRVVLFPRASGVEYALADEADRAAGVEEGGLEDVLSEIDELKNELTLIECKPTANNARERWDLPETGSHGRKDRYSALAMANLVARRLGAEVPTAERPDAYGGAVGELVARQMEERGRPGATGPLYVLTAAADPKLRAKAKGTWYGG
jgi:hypothetical protein